MILIVLFSYVKSIIWTKFPYDTLYEVLGGTIQKILNFLCANSKHHKIYFLWRPYLKDEKDDMVLELAVSSNSDYIITFNKKDFIGVEKFGIQILTPKKILENMGEK